MRFSEPRETTTALCAGTYSQTWPQFAGLPVRIISRTQAQPFIHPVLTWYSIFVARFKIGHTRRKLPAHSSNLPLHRISLLQSRK